MLKLNFEFESNLSDSKLISYKKTFTLFRTSSNLSVKESVRIQDIHEIKDNVLDYVFVIKL